VPRTNAGRHASASPGSLDERFRDGTEVQSRNSLRGGASRRSPCWRQVSGHFPLCGGEGVATQQAVDNRRRSFLAWRTPHDARCREGLKREVRPNELAFG
ncbi:unnamed protein product, partial [Ectocarpus sp. 12 AP-2014]